MMTLPPRMEHVFKGAYPSTIVTVSADGIPNIANLSRVWRADPGHVAVANQFLNKTAANLDETGLAAIHITDPVDLLHWELDVRPVRSETSGALFAEVKRDLQAVSWMAGIAEPVPLRSVIVFRVMSARKSAEEAEHEQPAPELLGELLAVLADTYGWTRSSFWTVQDKQPALRLVASRGVPGAGTHASVFAAMNRLAALVSTERNIVRLHDIRSQMRYMHTIHGDTLLPADGQTNTGERSPGPQGHFLGIPIIAFDAPIGVVSCEGSEAEPFDQVDDSYLMLLSRKIGEAITSGASIHERDYGRLFRQMIERARLEWTKKTDPFHTVLSARERQVCIHVAQGRTNAEIAKELFISTRTVTTHMERIFLKLQVTSRAALTRYIVENQLHVGEDGAGDPSG